MIILKRQDVEISQIQHPKRDRQLAILTYQGQTFRLISVFAANQAEEAKNFWRDLTDHQGKFCILLQEQDRYSVWGKVNLEQVATETPADDTTTGFTKACLLLMQTVYFDIEDMLGSRQAKLFQKDITNIFSQWNFPQADSPKAVNRLLTDDPIEGMKIPQWEEHHLITLLQELYRLGKEYFGTDNFAKGIGEILLDLPGGEKKQFVEWLNQSPLGQLWQE